jgi:protein-S-isoprenylcysteine O-methyltransferase Ste14
MKELHKKAFSGLFFLVVSLSAMLFLPAWTVTYWQAWVFLAVFTASVLAITVYLMIKDPKLLERRIHAGPVSEKRVKQKSIQCLAQLAFAAMIIFPPVDHRFAWSVVVPLMVATGDILVVLGLLIVFFAFRANSFASAIIDVDAEQKVIATGPYAIVRHPMYSGALLMLSGVPPALGSWWGLFALMPMTLVIVWRLLDEEKFLAKNLPGYAAYRNRVKYRLVPFIW